MLRPQAIPHSIDAIKVSQHLGHAFVEAARRSTHRPESEEEELEMQIYNVAPVFTARDVVMEPSYDGAHRFFLPRADANPQNRTDKPISCVAAMHVGREGMGKHRTCC